MPALEIIARDFESRFVLALRNAGHTWAEALADFVADAARRARRRDGVPFAPCLFRITYNESISILRLRRVRPVETLALTLAHPGAGPVDQVQARADLRDIAATEQLGLPPADAS